MAGLGLEGGYDGAADVNTGNTSNDATGVATIIGSAEALDNSSSMIPPTSTGTGGYSGMGGSFGPGGPIGGVYRERRMTAMARFI